MGNRVVVVFTDGAEYSPCIYLHWHASELGDLLTKWRQRMAGRDGDLQYGAARFVGVCHERIEGNLSLGIWNSRIEPGDDEDKHRAPPESTLRSHSPGDAGVVLVNVKTYSIRRIYGGTDRAEWALRECPLPDGWRIPAPAAPQGATP